MVAVSVGLRLSEIDGHFNVAISVLDPTAPIESSVNYSAMAKTNPPTTVKEYVDSLSDDRKKVVKKLRTTIRKNLPKGFKETISYGMIGYVVPHSLYKDGYHCDPKLPLPFMSLASQKNFVAVYHLGIYADPKLMKWFTGQYPSHCDTKLDMGKSCIRFKKIEQIPYELIGELCTKMDVQSWIDLYEKQYKKK